ncbi:histidinol dehydrogenase [Legionella jordanis]|uniref:histidinol dehydrogenase n=1 Tax=Legionella jordanis TaxID=456 RepID=UPI000EFE5A6F|nr:histidinol dehydrogenase [Legionella jordanis]RMX18747.1 histidinol dehydrogenase [Legionella jordanis]HAT8713024.1 histidinol dehydrogenase [Legionella jordanis]
MLTINNWDQLTKTEKAAKLARPINNFNFKQQVSMIIETVKCQGDAALVAFTRQFDDINLEQLRVPFQTIAKAKISLKATKALMTAIETISNYHQAMLPQTRPISTRTGITLEKLYRPINKVGLYVPGGNKTPLVSSLLMQAIPAKIAGCPIKILCTPPSSDGPIDPHLLVAARLCGIEEIYQIGGAQAIAAMAYGTESLVKVDKIFGPGNSFVTEAKNQVAADPLGAAIDMPAGPSEVMILADDEANPEFVAADLLAQAEHGMDSQVILISSSELFANSVQQALIKQMAGLSRREIIQASLEQSSIIVCRDKTRQINIVNDYAPEHLILNCKEALSYLKDITAAGTIFIGEWAAETLGDYVTGSNHVLPTNGYARNHSGLGILDFLKSITVQQITAEGITQVGEAAQTLAHIEGLDAHAQAVKLRMDFLQSELQKEVMEII